VGAEDTGFTAGAKAETFEAFEVFQVQEETQAQEGAQLSLDQLERMRIWTIESTSRQAGGECTGERDLGHQIWAHGPIAIGSRRSCTRFNPHM
jgi:hypothetical protein